VNAPELEALIGRYLDSVATAAEAAALSRELETSREARQVYLRFARLHASLTAEGCAPVAAPAPKSVCVQPWRRWIGVHPLAAAVVFAMLALGIAGGWLSWQRMGEADAAAAPVAEFGALQDCRWVLTAEESVQPGDPIRAGRRLDLASGSAAVRFASGAVATLLGPCIFEITSDNSGFLTLGQVKVIAATPESKGFTVQTRTARVVDVGTEFVAAAAADGQSRVDVTSGEVYVVVDGSEAIHRLRTGDALSVEAGVSKVMVRIESGTGTAAFQFPSIEPPSAADYADASRGLARISVAAGRLHAAGSVPSGPAEVLLNGRGQSVSDSPAESVFFDDNASGLLLLDLGRPVTVSKINTYSWHQNRVIEGRVRAVQKFTLYGYAGDVPPPVDGALSDSGWVQIARVDSDDYFRVGQPIDRPAQQACSITGAHGAIGRYRYLLWQAEPTQTLNMLYFNNTFYAEFDIYGDP
jgi:ferric-dicitrate binding protein FerR (iron transport regulator)